jgi:hypothetical protein
MKFKEESGMVRVPRTKAEDRKSGNTHTTFL